MVYRSWLWVPMVALVSACSGGGQAVSNQTGSAASDTAIGSNKAAIADPTNGQSASDVPTQNRAKPAASREDGNPPPLASIGLTKGVYAQVQGPHGTPECPPPLAVVAIFDGTGFGSRNSADCTFDPVSHDGAIWTGTQHCTDPASKTAQNEAWKIRIDSPTRYTRLEPSGPVHYALCPAERLSDWGG